MKEGEGYEEVETVQKKRDLNSIDDDDGDDDDEDGCGAGNNDGQRWL